MWYLSLPPLLNPPLLELSRVWRLAYSVSFIRARGEGGLPPERDVNLFILRAGGRGLGEMAAQGLFPGSASVCLSVCLFVPAGLVVGRGANFGARTGPNDSGERDLHFRPRK